MGLAPFVTAASDIPAAPVLGVMTLGVVVAIMGHIARSSRVVAVGIAAIFVATALMIVVGFVAYDDDPRDPRDCEGAYSTFCR